MLDYYTNTAAFAKNCVNKSRPKMHCNGKCQMMKKLLEEEKKDQQMPERKFEKKIEIICANTTLTAGVKKSLTLIPLVYHEYFAMEQKMPRSVFHPPAA